MSFKNQIVLCVIAAFCLELLSGCGGSSGSSASADQQAYSAGIAAYDAKAYPSAKATLESFTVTYPNSALIDKAYFFLGKSLYFLDDFTAAIAKFDIVLKNYPASSLADNAQFWTGKSLQRLANIEFSALNTTAAAALFADARAAYQLVITAYPSSSLIPDSHYHIGATYYDEKRYADAVPLLQAVVVTYPISGAADGAQYHLARSIHALAQAAAPTYTFQRARDEYVKVLNYPLSIWIDNAQYQIGKTYYDEANQTTVVDQVNFEAAIKQFNLVLATYTVATSTIVDSARYFKARSIHALAQAAAPTYTFQKARDEYAILMTYTGSTLMDNAQYQIGKTFYDEANYTTAITEFDKVFAYPMSTSVDNAQYYKARSVHALAKLPMPAYTFQQARDEYAKVMSYPASIFVDNASFHSALTYHDSKQCNRELAAMNTFKSSYPSSIFVAITVDNADAHIKDLNLTKRQVHTTCI